MPGPLPTRNPRRRNAPTIPTTKLPASGRTGPAPRPPKAFALGDAGKAWWKWAWKLPEACAWSDATIYVAVRRAALEDDLATLNIVPFDLGPLVTGDEEISDFIESLERALRSLTRQAAGQDKILKEMRELDDRLGLTPRARAQLRWSIEDDTAEEPTATPSNVRRLKAVDSAVAGA